MIISRAPVRISLGGGGFFMFYAPENHDVLTRALKEMGLKPMKYRFDFEGAKILVNMK
jgi:D-glycero-alpha-D-manno-heptose-7-phosphate kinase